MRINKNTELNPMPNGWELECILNNTREEEKKFIAYGKFNHRIKDFGLGDTPTEAYNDLTFRVTVLYESHEERILRQENYNKKLK